MRTRILGGERSERSDVGMGAHAGQELCNRWVEWSVTEMTLDGRPLLKVTCVMTGVSL